MTKLQDEKAEAMSQEALRESPKFYRGAHLGTPLDEVTGNPIFENAHQHMSRDSDDENELDAMLVESGVNETGDDNDSRFASGKSADELEADEEEGDEDAEENNVDTAEFSAEEEDEEDPDYKSREDDSDLGHLSNSLPLQADRDL